MTIDPDRLSELETWRPEDDTPDDAKVRIPAGDLRDLVALIALVRAAQTWREGIGTDEPEASGHGAGIQSTHPAAEESVVDAPAVTSPVPPDDPVWIATFAASFARETARADHGVACERARAVADAAVLALGKGRA